MRILIADDEIYVRSALKSMLLELDSETRIIGEASDGRQMAELAIEKQPDVVFVDIRMPQIDGLEGIEMAKPSCTHTSWVILSGFSDFTYAQKAITLGVREYLLKPVSPEKLDETLRNIQAQKKQVDLSRDTDFQHYLITNYYMQENSFRRNIKLDSLKVMGMEIIPDTWLEDNDRGAYLERFQQALERRLEELRRSNIVSGALFMTDVHEKWILAAGIYPGETDRKQQQEQVNSWFLSIQKELQNHCDKDFSLTGIKTPWCANVRDLITVINDCEDYVYLRMLYGMGRIWSTEELKEKKADTEDAVRGFCRSLEQLAEARKIHSYLNFLSSVSNAGEKWADCIFMCSFDQISNLKHYIAVSVGLNRTVSLDQFRQMSMGELLTFIGKNAGILSSISGSSKSDPDVVNQTIEYVENHYYIQDISIARIAEQLNLTPNYLSALFHKKKGITFVKYLTKVRMQKAEELLLNTNLTVAQIATDVGYAEARYFTKVFKEYFGVLPVDYRRKK